MKELTEDQQKALKEVRTALYERLGCFLFTEQMDKSRSIFQLLCLLQLLVGHRNWIGQLSHTAWTLDQVFGYDAIHDEPTAELENAAVVN